MMYKSIKGRDRITRHGFFQGTMQGIGRLRVHARPAFKIDLYTSTTPVVLRMVRNAISVI